MARVPRFAYQFRQQRPSLEWDQNFTLLLLKDGKRPRPKLMVLKQFKEATSYWESSLPPPARNLEGWQKGSP
jgi:hypothetical protein